MIVSVKPEAFWNSGCIGLKAKQEITERTEVSFSVSSFCSCSERPSGGLRRRGKGRREISSGSSGFVLRDSSMTNPRLPLVAAELKGGRNRSEKNDCRWVRGDYASEKSAKGNSWLKTHNHTLLVRAN